MKPHGIFHVTPASAGQTVAAFLRRATKNLSWTEARNLVACRRVEVNGVLTLDDARRLNPGEVLELLAEPGRPTPREQDVVILFVDLDLIVLNKPAGIQTVRRHEELGWDNRRKAAQPTFDELVARMLYTPRQPKPPRVRVVHRLDRDTSGLMLFALSSEAERELVRMFAAHEVRRTYTAVVRGRLCEPRTIDTHLVRDRGDGLRGSSPLDAKAIDSKRAVTHVRPIEHLGTQYTIAECELETGRTHQIRIHLSELGHRLCGEKLYTHPMTGAPAVEDDSGAPRQALHSSSLELTHPITRRTMRFSNALPCDLENWLKALRSGLEK